MATNSQNDPLLVVLVGPTASGKTALSLALAEHLNGEIISCDSVAVYRGMDIGSAKPTPAEQARIPHHLTDVATPATDYTAGDYGRAARAAAHSIASRGKTPIVAGGTGLYLRAFLDGLSPMPTRNEALRDRLRTFSTRRGPASLHRLLTRLDPAAAASIHPNDEPKLIRALEVRLLARQPITEAWQDQRPEPLTGFHVVQFGLAPPRADLYTRINARCAAMFANGLIEETRNLIAEYGPTPRAFQALGYAQASAVLRNELTEPEAIAATQQGHRNYSKRQGTWFRRDPRIHWLPTFGETALPALLQALKA
ncbi:tRNA (adenosine(37)-N6)-dimethylallyltransferase MiaA [Terriglobus aquaticus]|uniref:tRNA dimethylallyltransferase n=1 Tax=Terriglobus aquaticus TaxID=940139 RepID=A0ABW9KMG1_9BACT|nr:tRNA (adenosine(37)-N6)-dimethylallyltransferase MiaA [Terriglobus aquaticus]